MFNRAQFTSAFRWGITTACGYFVANGLISDDVTTLALSASGGIVTLAWGIASHYAPKIFADE